MRQFFVLGTIFFLLCVDLNEIRPVEAADGSTDGSKPEIVVSSNRNLAFEATVSATSEYSSDYSAQGAIDGIVPEAKSHNDLGRAWAIQGTTAKGNAEFLLEWETPVVVSEIVYFGRTGSDQLEECFKDYEIRIDGDETPIVVGTLEMRHGSQRISIPKSSVSTLSIRFRNGYAGGKNHGASEIAVFAEPTTDDRLAASITPELAAQAQGLSLDSFLEAGLPTEIVFAVRKPGTDPHWYANFGYYADNSCRYPFPLGAGGALLAYNVETGETRSILEDWQGNVRDPQVDYDAKKILFSYLPSGKKHYSLYEIKIDGTELRQLTGIGEDAPLQIPSNVQSSTSSEMRTSAARLGDQRDFAPPGWDDFEPTYLPDGSVVFCSTRAKRFVGCWETQVATLHKRTPDGKILELSCNVEQDNTPWVLPNGQIIYMRWEYVDRSQVDYHHLWTTSPDGTRQMILYGNLKPGISMLDPKPIPGSNKIVCIFSPGHGMIEHYGRTTVVDPQFGPDSPEAVRYISRDNNQSDPWAFDERHFMAASRDKIVLTNENGRELVLYQLPDELARRGFWVHEPRPIAPREREPVFADQTDLSKKNGSLALLNVYQGRKMKNLAPGTVKKLLIYETLPKPIHYTGGTEMASIFGTFMIERLLGTVPVNDDGSAYFELPANRPVLFLALDENERCVKRMHSFTSVRPGETTTCIGCHEERTETPSLDDKKRLMKLMNADPAKIEPIPDVPDVFCFVRDIQPILDRYCLECHNPDREEGNFNVSGHWSPLYTIGYAQMSWLRLFGDNRNRAQSNFEPYEIGSGSSRLLQLIDEKHAGVEMSEQDRRIVRLWIDAGANYAGTYAAGASGGIGYYIQNLPVRNEKDWPETAAMRRSIAERCDSCHAPTDDDKNLGKYDIYVDNYTNRNPRDAKDRFIPHDLAEGNGRYSRLEIFDLSYPEQSKILRAPLAKEAGGFGVCRTADDSPVFRDRNDVDYQAILAGIERGRKYILEEDNRFSMITPSPNNGLDCPTRFVPRWVYLREMIRYGILPPDADPNASYDPYELDRKYWESLWLSNQ